MNTPARTTLVPRHARRHRRGSVYVLVLGLATIASVIGAGAIAVTRLGTRSTQDNRDWNEASVLAVSGVEAGIAKVNSDLLAALDLGGGGDSGPIPLGRGTARYRIIDQSGGLLGLGGGGPVRVYGFGEVGRARRCFSTLMLAEGGPPPTAFQCAAYASGAVSLSGTTTFIGGPVGSGLTATVNLLARVNGGVEGLLVVSLGTITGGTRLLSLGRTMPSPGVFDFYAGMATPVSYASLSGGALNSALLSAGSNPWGATNTDGVYAIDVPGGSTLTIRQSRLVATLVVNLQAGSKLRIDSQVLWEPAGEGKPLVIVRSAGSATVEISGGTNALTETSGNKNYNPSHTPYQSQSDGDISDTYPAELRGVIHVIGGATTNVSNSSKIIGALITEGALNVSGGSRITLDGTLATEALMGYATNSGEMNVVRGSWRWESGAP